MTTTIEITNTTDASQKTLHVSFKETRSVLRGLEASKLGTPITARLSGTHSFAVVIPGGGLKAGASMSMEVDYLGEPLSEPSVSFRPSGSLLPALSDAQERFTANLPFTITRADRNVEARLAATDNEDRPDYRRASIFFAEYDNQTYPPLIPINQNIPEEERQIRVFIIMKAADIMAKRVMLRGLYAQRGEVPDSEELTAIRFVDPRGNINEPLRLEEVQYLSEIQRPIFERNHGTPPEIESVAESFEVFANGEIRFIGGVSNAEPDSAYEFSFAEFALTCVQFGVDAQFWGNLAPAIAMSQEIFMQVYRPTSSEPFGYRDYRASNFSADRQVTSEFKEALRGSYLGMTPDQVARRVGENALTAFPADYTTNES